MQQGILETAPVLSALIIGMVSATAGTVSPIAFAADRPWVIDVQHGMLDRSTACMPGGRQKHEIAP